MQNKGELMSQNENQGENLSSLTRNKSASPPSHQEIENKNVNKNKYASFLDEKHDNPKQKLNLTRCLSPTIFPPDSKPRLTDSLLKYGSQNKLPNREENIILQRKIGMNNQ